MINVPLMRKVLEHISEHPEEHDQGIWAERNACGTSMCMAGHTVVMAGHELDWGRDCLHGADAVTKPVMIEDGGEVCETTYIPHVAAAELGLNGAQATDLFYKSMCIEDLWHAANKHTDGEIEIPEQYQEKELY